MKNTKKAKRLQERLAKIADDERRMQSGISREAEEIGFLVLKGEYELIKVADRPSVELPTDDAELDSLVEAVLDAGKERSKLVDQLRRALEAKQQELALVLAHELCNLQQKGGEPRGSRSSSQAVH